MKHCEQRCQNELVDMQQRLSSIALSLPLLLITASVVCGGGVVIEDNGYTNVVIALDYDLPQPAEDGGQAFLLNLQVSFDCLLDSLNL